MQAILAVILGCIATASPIRDDERVLFYPTYATYDQAAATWTLCVHAIAFEPEESSLRRRAMIKLIGHFAKLKPEEESSELFRERIRPFLYDNERGKDPVVEVRQQRVRLPETEANGHTETSIRLELKESASPKTFTIRTKARDGRVFSGKVHAIRPKGLSVISDIDDTIKISQVADRKELVRNTFVRPFKAVPGTATIYRELAKQGAAFHYVSGSPWQLYEPLEQFLAKADFPAGTFHLRNFRLKDRTATALFQPAEKHKLAAIRRLLRDFPERRFLLIGDSGEQDPEIYCQIAREHPKQIVGIFIRTVTDPSTEAARYAKLVEADSGEKEKNLPKLRPGVFHAFQNADELRKKIEKVSKLAPSRATGNKKTGRTRPG